MGRPPMGIQLQSRPMPASPNDRKYTDTHEWHKSEGDLIVLGLTPFAVAELTDITFVEMQAAGTQITPGDSLGEVESVKATSDVYSAVPGEIAEVNEALADNPSLLNSDPFGQGWLLKIRTADPSPLDNLMDHKTYDSRFPVKQ